MADDVISRAIVVVESVAGFLDAIKERTPNGEWIAVQYHPNGDWSVARKPLDRLSPDLEG